jgi:hypothetical protein
MNARKLTYDDLPAMIEMPREFQHHPVQITIVPLDDASSSSEKKNGRPTTWLANFAGKWQGETLVREEQGEYEARDELK